MHDMVNELGIEKDQIISRDQAITWFSTWYPKIKRGTISAHLIRLSTNAPSRIHHHPKPGDDDLFFQIDGSHFRLYELASDPSPIYERPPINIISKSDGDSSEPRGEFAYESDLRDILAKNLSSWSQISIFTRRKASRVLSTRLITALSTS